MKRANPAKWLVAFALLGGSLVGGAGCDQHVADQLATLSGNYVGDVVSTVVTHYLQGALGVENAADALADSHDHEHDTGALHDHEH